MAQVVNAVTRLTGRALSVLLVLALIAAGCGDDDDDATGGTAGDEPASEELAWDPDATLNAGWPYEINNFDPARSTSQVDLGAMGPVYDRLVAQNGDGSLGPMLATSWEFSADGRQLTMELQEGVTFSDGTPFDAEAVKLNVERFQTHPESRLKSGLAPIESVDVVDDLTVRFNLGGGGAYLPYEFSGRSGMMVSPAAFENPDLDHNPVGTGPYLVKPGSFQVGAEVTFIRNPDYWGDESAQKLSELRLINAGGEDARLNALQSGQVDVTLLTSRTAPDSEALEATGDFNRVEYVSTRSYLFHMNLDRNPALQDVRVRRAISMAIDRETIAATVFNGACEPTYQPLRPNMPGYDPDLEGTYAYDPEGARALLEDAGYSDLQLDYVIGQGATAEPLQVVMGDTLSAVGINMVSHTTTPALSSTDWFDGKFDLIAQLGIASGDPAQVLYSFVQDNYLPGGTTARVDEVVRDVLDPITDEEEKDDKFREASRVIVEDAVHAFVCVPSTYVTSSAGVVGTDNVPYASETLMDPRNFGVAAEA